MRVILNRMFAFCGLSFLLLSNLLQASEEHVTDLIVLKTLNHIVPVFNSHMTEVSIDRDDRFFSSEFSAPLRGDWVNFYSAEHIPGNFKGERGVFIVGNDLQIFLPFKHQADLEEMRYIETFEETLVPGEAANESFYLKDFDRTVIPTKPAVSRAVEHQGKVLIDRWRLEDRSRHSIFISVIRLEEPQNSFILGYDPSAVFTFVRIDSVDSNKVNKRRDADEDFIKISDEKLVNVAVSQDAITDVIFSYADAKLEAVLELALDGSSGHHSSLDLNSALERRVFYTRRNFLLRRVYSRDLQSAIFEENPKFYISTQLKILRDALELAGNENAAKRADEISSQFSQSFESREMVNRSLNRFFSDIDAERKLAVENEVVWRPDLSPAIRLFYFSGFANPFFDYEIYRLRHEALAYPIDLAH